VIAEHAQLLGLQDNLRQVHVDPVDATQFRVELQDQLAGPSVTTEIRIVLHPAGHSQMNIGEGPDVGTRKHHEPTLKRKRVLA
jgi:hypothetical protein